MLNQNKNLLTSAMEDYLEMIYRCSKNNNFVRLSTLAQMLNVKDSSASKMMRKLGDLSLINYEKYGIITLTDKGKELGLFLFKRHDIIEKFLENLTQNSDMLTETELIEHVISKETVEALKLFNTFFEAYPNILIKYWAFKNDKKNT